MHWLETVTWYSKFIIIRCIGARLSSGIINSVFTKLTHPMVDNRIDHQVIFFPPPSCLLCAYHVSRLLSIFTSEMMQQGWNCEHCFCIFLFILIEHLGTSFFILAMCFLCLYQFMLMGTFPWLHLDAYKIFKK